RAPAIGRSLRSADSQSGRYSRSPVVGSYQTRISFPDAGSVKTSSVGRADSPAAFRLLRYRSHPNTAAPTPTATTATITHPITFMGARSACRIGWIGRRPLDHAGRPVRDDLAHAPAHLRRVEAHHGHRVRSHRGGVLHHAVDGLTPSILVQLDVGADLAP